MSLFDRGTKKWTAMMLPEHVVQLRGIWQDDGKEEHPVIDAATLAEISDRINSAIKFNQEIEITYWICDQVVKVSGRVHQVNQRDEYYYFVQNDGSFIKIYFDEILDANVLRF